MRILGACQVALPLIAAAPVHAADAPRCTYVDIATLPIRYIDTGMEPAVDGTINGKPATMLVDTGADTAYLTMTAVRRYDLGTFMTGTYIRGIGGSSRLYSARLKDFSVGPARSSGRTELTVIGNTTSPPAYDAIVGAAFLLQSDLEVDLRAKRMKFYRPQDCGKTPLLLWQEETVTLPFERSFDSSKNPHFTVLVNGTKLDAVIDTGAHRSTLMLDAAKRAGIDINAPGALRLPDVGGVGTERAPHWTVPVKTIQLGGETIQDAELGVIDAHDNVPVDLLLGQDFLRTHRVLFAMSQDKLYIAYLGGDVFTRGTGLEPWMRAEADAGNPAAQFVLAMRYADGRGVARDPAQARAWLDKAAAGGEPHAELRLGHIQMQARQWPQAVASLRAGLDQLPAERIAPLWLYTARVRNGEADLARSELEATVKRQDDDDWPAPLAAFYLGKLDAAHVLNAAGKDRQAAQARTCQADGLMADWHTAHGDIVQAKALLADMRARCAAPAPAPASVAAPAAGASPPGTAP